MLFRTGKAPTYTYAQNTSEFRIRIIYNECAFERADPDQKKPFHRHIHTYIHTHTQVHELTDRIGLRIRLLNVIHSERPKRSNGSTPDHAHLQYDIAQTSKLHPAQASSHKSPATGRLEFMSGSAGKRGYMSEDVHGEMKRNGMSNGLIKTPQSHARAVNGFSSAGMTTTPRSERMTTPGHERMTPGQERMPNGHMASARPNYNGGGAAQGSPAMPYGHPSAGKGNTSLVPSSNMQPAHWNSFPGNSNGYMAYLNSNSNFQRNSPGSFAHGDESGRDRAASFLRY